MSWKPRQPATQESGRKTRMSQSQLEELGLSFEPGYNCPSCGQPVSVHGDVDCITVLINAIKTAGATVARASDNADELEDLRELRRLVEAWVVAGAGDRSDAYAAIVAHLHST